MKKSNRITSSGLLLSTVVILGATTFVCAQEAKEEGWRFTAYCRARDRQTNPN